MNEWELAQVRHKIAEIVSEKPNVKWYVSAYTATGKPLLVGEKYSDCDFKAWGIIITKGGGYTFIGASSIAGIRLFADDEDMYNKFDTVFVGGGDAV